MCLKGKKVLAEVVVIWVVTVDGVSLLVECMTMLEVVGGVLVKDVVTHTIVERRYVELLVSHIVVVATRIFGSHVVVMNPFDELGMT